jgi:uncharacterized protein (DUF2147 family)
MRARRTIETGHAMIAFACVVWCVLCGGSALANELSPKGIWTTIDDDGETATSIIEIDVREGRLSGYIVELLKPEDVDSICDRCTGELKDAPMVGLRVLSGLVREGRIWSGGVILDPENGKQYRCRLQLSEDGKTLAVRGYLGITILGRTQHWRRGRKSPKVMP